MFLQKNRKQFWQPHPETFAKKLNFFCAVYERFLKTNSFQTEKFCLKCSYGHVDSHFDRPIELLSAEGQKIFIHF